MGRGGRLFYLKPTSRDLVKKLMTELGGSRKLKEASGIRMSHVGLHRIAAGETKGSWAIPELLSYFQLDPREHIDLELGEELTDGQIAWLKLLADLQRAGKDPAKAELALRIAFELPITQAK